jgi:hypothetical protein
MVDDSCTSNNDIECLGHLGHRSSYLPSALTPHT